MNLSYLQNPSQITNLIVSDKKYIGVTTSALSFKFSLIKIPNTENAIFTVEAVNSVLDEQREKVLEFSTSTTFQLGNFNQNPDIFLLKQLVANAYNAHSDLLNAQNIKTIQPINMTMPKISYDQVESALNGELNTVFQ